jgi:hypothetical protein
MSEREEYWAEANEPRKWSETEMEQKFDELYESIMLEVREMFYADTKTTYFTYKSKNRYSYKKRYEITDAIYSGLIGLELIEQSRKDDWHKLFNGEQVSSDVITFEWKGAKNLLPYLIQKLAVGYHFITDINLHKKMKLFFGVKNTAQLVNRYHESKTGKPKGHEQIDNMLSFIEW